MLHLSYCGVCFLAVRCRVVLSRFRGVVLGLYMMAVGHMGVVAGLFVVACLVMLRGGQVVFRSLLVVRGCLAVMYSALLRHGESFHMEISNA